MSTDDDDLPVLTQVLRIGSGPMLRRINPAPADGVVDPGATALERVAIPDQLVIGNEPRQDAEAEAADLVAVPMLPPDAEPERSSVNAPEAVVPIEDPATLARRVREAVLADLVTRIDTELDARIAQAIHIEVETAVAQLQDKLRVHLTESLRDVVARAVDDEIGRLTQPVDPRNA
jgi:hypothetical protein